MLRAGRIDLESPQQSALQPPAVSDATDPSRPSHPTDQQQPAPVLAAAPAPAGSHSTSRLLRGRSGKLAGPSVSSQPVAPSQVLQAARAALRPTQAVGHASVPARLAVPTSPVSDELLTPGQFTQPSPNPPTDPSPNPESMPTQPQLSSRLHAGSKQQGHRAHAPPDLTPAVLSASQPAAQSKQHRWEDTAPPTRTASPMLDALSASDDAAPLSGPASLSLDDVPVRRQTIRTHGGSQRQQAIPSQPHGSSHAASDFHSTFSEQHGGASRSRSPPIRSPHLSPQRGSSPPLCPTSLDRGNLPEGAHVGAADNGSSHREAPPVHGASPSPHQRTPVSVSHPSDSPAGPGPDILGLLETGAQPPAAFYDNEHMFTIDPPPLGELDPEEQITPHDIPSPLKATSRRTLFLQQGLPVGESRSSRSLRLDGLPEDKSPQVDLSEEKREQQQEHIRLQLEAFVLSSRRNSHRYMSQRSMDPLATVTALQGSSTHSQDVATSEGRQSPSPHHRSSPTRHHTSSHPHNSSVAPSGAPLGTRSGSLPRTRSSSRPPSRSHSERRKRGEIPHSNSNLQPHSRQEGAAAGGAQVDSHRSGRREMGEQGAHVAAHVTSHVQHPLQHATSAPQPVSPVSAPTDVVEPVQECSVQVSSPIVVEGPDAGTGRGVPWEDSARELEGHGPGGKPSPADKSSQQHSKPGHHTLHHAPRNTTGRRQAEAMPEGDTALAGTDSKLQAEFVEAAKRAKALQTRQRLKSTGSASLAEGGAEALKLLDARRDKRMDPRERTLLWLQSTEAHEEEPAPKLPSPTPSAPSSIATATTGVATAPAGTPRVNSRKKQEGIGRLGVARQPGCVAFGGSGQTSGKQRSGRFAWLQCFGATAVRGE